jgi:hypothetical protein
MVIYSTSQVESITIDFFFEDYVKSAFPMKKTNLDVFFLSSKSPAQSLSQHLTSLKLLEKE